MTLFVFRFGRMVRRLAGRGAGARGAGRGVTMGWSWFGGIAETVTSCNSPGTRIGLPGPSRAYQLARWHRFVSIERPEPRQTALQSTFARAMISRKITEDQRPSTHGPQSPVSARTLAFLKFIWHPNRPSSALQGTFARAMVCRKIIEDQRPATHGPQSAVSARSLAFLQFTWHPNRPSRALQGTFRFQVEPNCAHLDLFRELTA